MMSSSKKKPLRFAVSGALLVGSLSACGASEPRPGSNEAREPPSHDPAPNEDGQAHDDVDGDDDEGQPPIALEEIEIVNEPAPDTAE